MVSIVGPLHVMVTGPHTNQAARDALEDVGLAGVPAIQFPYLDNIEEK